MHLRICTNDGVRLHPGAPVTASVLCVLSHQMNPHEAALRVCSIMIGSSVSTPMLISRKWLIGLSVVMRHLQQGHAMARRRNRGGCAQHRQRQIQPNPSLLQPVGLTLTQARNLSAVTCR